MKSLYMGIDVGTQSSKGVLCLSDGSVVASAEIQHGMDNPQPGWYEQDAEQVWWHDVCRLSQRLLERVADRRSVQVIGISALGCDCVPVDRDLRPLSPAILYGIDSRCTEEITWLRAYFGERCDEIFGHELCTSDVAPKILWFKNHRPDVHRRAYKFLTASSFLTARLCGRCCLDRYLMPDFAPLYLENGRIDKERCSLFCRPDQLAEVTMADECVGSLTREAAAATGLAAGTPVLTGTGDSGAEAVSAGVLRPGDMMIQLGSTCYFVCCTESGCHDGRLWSGEYIRPGTCCVTAGTNNGGTLTKYYRDCFGDILTGGSRQNAYGVMAERAAAIPAGSDGLITLPYFSGERTPINDPNACGMIFGLRQTHSAAHMYRSALEGIGYSIWQNYDVFIENHLPIHRILVTGGGTKNRVWLQIIADMLNRELLIPSVTVGAAYGDALLCMLSDGAAESWDSLESLVKIGKVIQPIEENHRLYAERKDIFVGLYKKNQDYMHRL